MTQKEYDALVEKIQEYADSIEVCDNESRERKEYVDAILDQLSDEDSIMESYDTYDDLFQQLFEEHDYTDGGYKEDIYPDVDEDDNEYPEDYNPCDNEQYEIHRQVLEDIQNMLDD
ncbi:MAG: hypothetical protein MJZ64_07285 [Paludibacteraceae bacterium]|nr:hypothetical protein [Paludibacteraceae bacterium]